MKYLKLYEAFKSELLSKTLSFLSESGKKSFMEKIKNICDNIDFPMSELDDSIFQKMNFDSALKLDVDEKHPVGIIKWVKFWFDRNGDFVMVTATNGVKKYLGTEQLQDFEVVKELGHDELVNLKTGDKVYIRLDNYPEEPVVATAYRYFSHEYGRDKLYMIQNEWNGGSPDNQDWEEYGRYSWIITSTRDYVGVPKLLRKIDTGEKEKNEYAHNFELYTAYALRPQFEDVQDKLKRANFALVMDLGTLQLSEYKTTTSIGSERVIDRKGATALMSDEQIKTINLTKYFNDLKDKINFSSDLSNLKSLLIKLMGGRKLLVPILMGEYYVVDRLVRLVFGFLRLVKHYEDDETYKDTMESKIWDIENLVKSSYNDQFSRDRLRSVCIGEIKQKLGKSPEEKLIFEFIFSYEKMIDDFFNSLNQKEINTLEDLEVLNYKFVAIHRLLSDSPRFADIKSIMNSLSREYSSEIVLYRLKDLPDKEEKIQMMKDLSSTINKIFTN